MVTHIRISRMEEKDQFGKYAVAISGIAGRYPESGNIDEFWSNLMSGTEMCVADDRRWPIGEFFFQTLHSSLLFTIL